MAAILTTRFWGLSEELLLYMFLHIPETAVIKYAKVWSNSSQEHLNDQTPAHSEVLKLISSVPMPLPRSLLKPELGARSHWFGDRILELLSGDVLACCAEPRHPIWPEAGRAGPATCQAPSLPLTNPTVCIPPKFCGDLSGHALLLYKTANIFAHNNNFKSPG